MGANSQNMSEVEKEGKQRRTRKRKKTKKNEEKEGDNGISNSLLKFRKWSKNGLKAQKLLAQGIALGKIAISKAPCKGKSLIYCLDFKAFALTGRQVCVRNNPGRCPGLGASALSGREELTYET